MFESLARSSGPAVGGVVVWALVVFRSWASGSLVPAQRPLATSWPVPRVHPDRVHPDRGVGSIGVTAEVGGGAVFGGRIADTSATPPGHFVACPPGTGEAWA